MSKFRIVKVRVIPRASCERIEKELDLLRVYLTVPPEEGKANKRLLEVLSEYLNCRKSSLKIIKGFNCRNKLIQIDED